MTDIDLCRRQQQAIEEYWAGEPDDTENQRIGAMIGWLDWEAEARILERPPTAAHQSPVEP